MKKLMLSAAVVLGFAGGASAADRHVAIVNETGMAITEFYASNAGTDDWQEDILGDDVLEAGDSVDVNIDDGSGACRFDFKAVFQNGKDLVRKNIDVCKIGRFTYTR